MQERINWTAWEAPGKQDRSIGQSAMHQGGTREAGKSHLDSLGGTREAGRHQGDL